MSYNLIHVLIGFLIICTFNNDPKTKRKLSVDNEYDWVLQKDEDGIKIFLRKMPNTISREFKCVTTLKTSLDGAVALIQDADAGKDWIQRAKIFKRLKTISDREWITYTEIEIPWPFENRDLITRNTIRQDSINKTVTISLIGDPDYIKEKDGITRMQKSEGKWIFRPLKDKIEATYTIYSDRSKTLIPHSIITPIIVNGLHDSIKKMRNLVEKEKYRSMSLSYIKN
jgi:hypothetical protein